ncbi:MAG: hypothetical protein WD490_06710 [Opitutales bacterium]
MKRILLLMTLFLFASCAQKWGVYTIIHEEQLLNGFSVRTIRHEDNVRCQVLRGGEIVGELDVDGGHIKTVISSYKKLDEGVDENLSVSYEGENLFSARVESMLLHARCSVASLATLIGLMGRYLWGFPYKPLSWPVRECFGHWGTRLKISANVTEDTIFSRCSAESNTNSRIGRNCLGTITSCYEPQ